MTGRRVCSVDGCDREYRARGLCVQHYQEARRSGMEPVRRTTPWVDRFWKRVERTDTCWLWTGARNDAGYGQLQIDGSLQYVHRLSLEIAGVTIPEGWVVDHLCRVRNCVRPDHLEPVTQRENMLRGVAPGALTAATDRCFRGHDMADAITVRRHGVVMGRRCRTCHNASRRQRRTGVER